MKQVTINLYSFNELSEEAQNKAIENLLDLNVMHEWWESTYEDAENIGLIITESDERRVKGHFDASAEETAHKIEKEHGDQCETHKTAKQYLSERDNLVAKYADGGNTVLEENEYKFDNECDELDSEFLKSLCEDYRIMLQKEYEYLTSREAVIESIEANEYTFESDGTLNNG